MNFIKKQAIHCRPIYGVDKSKKGMALTKFTWLAQIRSV
jgi:hypothetical protein